MNGFVDTNGRALIQIDLRPTRIQKATPIEVWIDTGFTGDLVLPKE